MSCGPEGAGKVASGFGHARSGSRPYRRHRPIPALVVIAALGLGAVFVWVQALEGTVDIDEKVRCDPAPTPPEGVTFTSVGHDALDDITPIPPDKVPVTVLNASDARGQAAITSEALRQLGFSQVDKPDNDPAYEGATANCRGQLRYGENGEAAARTLSLVDPCMELIRDTRKDSSVDLAIGTGFGDVAPRRAAREILDQLSAWSQREGDDAGSELANNDDAPPRIDADLLSEARSAHC
jgi:hypothetical protein